MKLEKPKRFKIFQSRLFLTEISDCTETVTKVSIRVCNVAFKLKK